MVGVEGGLIICGLVRIICVDIEVVGKVFKLAVKGCIYIFIVIFDIYLSYKFKKIRVEVLEIVLEMVVYVKIFVDDVEFFLEDVGCFDLEFFY